MHISRNSALAPAIVLMLAWSAGAAAAGPKAIGEADLREHIRILASDAFEGRQSGTPSERKTLEYIATALRKAGVRPGATDGSWFQPFRWVHRIPRGSTVFWRAGDVTLEMSAEDIVMAGPTTKATLEDAPVVFVGYGAQERGYENLSGTDLNGAVVLLLGAGAPPELRTDWNVTTKRIFERGAAAIVAVYPADWAWKNLREGWLKGTRQSEANARPGIGGATHASRIARFLTASGSDLAQLTKAATEKEFRATPIKARVTADVDTDARLLTSYNVVGRLAGRGDTGEAVALSAHWDGFGFCKPEGAPDRICNGAVDNASGVAVVIEMAERLARGRRPERDIMFIATGAEEFGSFGSDKFLADPPLPLEKLVAVLNIDIAALVPKGRPIGITGRGMTPMDPVIDKVAASLGRAIATGEEANEFLFRLDSHTFHKKGVPAITAVGFYADKAIRDAYEASGAYHGPNDEYSDTLELGGAVEDAAFNLALIRAIADPKRYSGRSDEAGK